MKRLIAAIITLLCIASVGSLVGSLGYAMRGEGQRSLALLLFGLMSACGAFLMFPQGARHQRRRARRRPHRFSWTSQAGYVDFENRYYQD
ncbi:hypothetical protein [Caulobacter endophyticus]|uniref:hypothetical protein n=1 Tax=Caulobacter endophyticus TaxID=2172652 RepID=UPI0024104ED9|nr:hypothetical protein [Caulobacter endophyticus]MDG2528265.1 hypothetical protein [Caulobacter endophyticus]